MMPPTLLALARAAAAGRPVRLACREGGPAPRRREVDVLSLGWRFGGWVALARDRADGGLRVLEVGRIVAARPLERRRRPRTTGHPGRAARHRPPPTASIDPEAFALADLQDPLTGPLRRAAVTVPAALAPLAGALFAGAEVEVVTGGVRVHLRVSDPAALAQMAASLGAVVG